MARVSYLKLSQSRKLEEGDQVGRLSILKNLGTRLYGGQYRNFWLCECACGETKEVADQALRAHRTLSCGCLAEEFQKSRGLTSKGRKPRKQGKTYRTWRDMKQRCDNPKHRSYKHYGGRGISYDPSWVDFKNFLTDMGEAPEGLSLDRVNNDAGYSSQNCRWATNKMQLRNRRNNTLIEHQGSTKTLAEWAEITGINYSTLSARIRKGDTGNKLFRPTKGRKIKKEN